jgi:hypothetical protein
MSKVEHRRRNVVTLIRNCAPVCNKHLKGKALLPQAAHAFLELKMLRLIWSNFMIKSNVSGIDRTFDGTVADP